MAIANLVEANFASLLVILKQYQGLFLHHNPYVGGLVRDVQCAKIGAFVSPTARGSSRTTSSPIVRTKFFA
jgi:hypothetical protein